MSGLDGRVGWMGLWGSGAFFGGCGFGAHLFIEADFFADVGQGLALGAYLGLEAFGVGLEQGLAMAYADFAEHTSSVVTA